MGLATGIGTVNRAFPHHYHHRKTNQTTTPNTPHNKAEPSGGSGPRTAQRTRTPQCKQPTTPHQGAAHATNEHTQKNSHAHTNPQGLMSDRCISTSQLHTSQCFHTRPINPIIYRTPHPTKMWAGNLISEQASRLDAFSGYPSRT